MAKKKNTQHPDTFYVVGKDIIQGNTKQRWNDALYELAMSSIREKNRAREEMEMADTPVATNPYATSAKQSLPNSFYSSRYSSNDYEPEKIFNQEEEDLQKDIFGNMDQSQREKYAWVFDKGGKEAALEYARSIGSGIRDDDEWLSTLDSGKVNDALYKRDKLSPSQYNYYKQMLNEKGRDVADNYLNNYRDGYYDRKAEKEVEKKRVEDLTREYMSSPEFTPGTQMSDEERQRQEWLQNNTFDMDFNQAAERAYGSEMNNKEREVYNYLANTQGNDKAQEYYQNIRRDLQRRATQTQKNWWTGYYDLEGNFHEGEAQKDPVGTTLYSIIVSPAKGIEYLSQVGEMLTTGKVNEDDFRNNALTNSAKYGRSAVSEMIGKNTPFGKFMYDVGTSMADFGFNMVLGNVLAGGSVLPSALTEAQKAAAEQITLSIMGTGAASDATLEAKERGLSDTQAMALGTIAGFAEYITEKVSLETLLKPEKSLLIGDKLRYVLKNAAAEGSEEIASDLINTVADAIITGNQNELAQRVRELVLEGKSEKEAFGIAVAEKVQNTLMSGLAGAVSGGLMGVGGSAFNSYNSAKFANETDLNTEEGMTGLIESGLESDPESESYELAKRLQDKRENGEKISNEELVGLMQANEEAIEAEGEASKVEVENYIKENGLPLKKGIQTVMKEMYDSAVPIDEYVTAMTEYYTAGAENKDIDSVDLPTDLTPPQMAAAYKAGQEEYANEGVPLHEGIQRNDGQDTGRTVSAVEEGTGSLSEGTGEAADREVAQIKTGERVTENKVDGDGRDYTLEYTPVTGGETTLMAEGRANIEELGAKIVFTKGNIIHTIKRGNEIIKTDARGFFDPVNKVIYIQADHPLFTANQLSIHEGTHLKIAEGKVSLKDVENRIAGRDLDELARDYKALYYGTTLSDDQIIEEIICDSMAEMNNFKGTSTLQTEKYQPYFETIKAKTEESTNQANAPPSEYLKQKEEIQGIKEANKKTESTPKEAASRETRAYKLSAESDRVFYVNGTEVVKNPTDQEYRQMREDFFKEYPNLRGTGYPALRRTFDEEGNEYYFSSDKIHAQVEPYINKKFNTRTSQHNEWWKRADKDDYPIDYGKFSAEPDYEDNAFSEGDPVTQTDSDIRFSKEVRDKKTLNFLNNQKTIKTYRTFQKIGDGLYAPMNAMENGKLGYKSMLGKWEQATEAPELAILNEKNGSYYFNLRSGNNTASGKGRTTKAAYNPYLHSSNLVFNDQFSAAYDRPNLVVAECEVPESEVTSGYHADKAKDSVGWLEWKSGKVANALRNKGIERKVMLSRWMKPVRILSNAEVAAKYKEALDGTDIKVPWNVVSPDLLSELEKVGVDIDYGYQSSVKASYEDKYGETRFSAEPTTDSTGKKLTKAQQNYFKDSKIVDENGNLLLVYHGTSHGGFTVLGNDLNYFTADKKYAQDYMRISGNSRQGDNPQLYSGYLNITKPFTLSAAKTKKIFVDEYIKGGYAQGINPGASQSEINNYIKNGIDWVEADNLKEFLDEKGYDYDGMILNEGGTPAGDRGASYVAFNSNQFKNADNTNPTKSDDFRFSMETPVEQKGDLIAVHNLGVDQLIKSIELGGFPMPSIAITKADMGHSMYGNESVVFRPETIDPKKSKYNKVYSGDAYTPEFPHVGYKVDNDRLSEIRSRVEDLMGDYKDMFSNPGLDKDNFSDKITRNSGSVVDAYDSNEALRYAFAKDKGIDFEMPTTKANLSPYFDNDLVKYVSLMFSPAEARRSYQTSLETYKQFSEDGRLDTILEKINAWEKKKYADTTFKNGKTAYDMLKTTEVPFNKFDNLLNAIVKYYNEGITDTVDRLAYSDKMDQVINDNRADYEKWLNDLFKGAIVKQGIRNKKDYMTSSGNRRSWDALYDDYTLDNIVKAMRGDQQTGKGSLGYSFLGSVHDEYKSLDDIRADKGRLQMMDESEYSDLKQEIWDDVYNVARRIRPDGNWDTLSAVSDIAEAVAKNKTESGIKRWLSQWYKVSDADMKEIMDLVKRARELPTGYFEAKPQRAIGLDEIASVIVPDTENDLIKVLEDNNIPYKTYKHGDQQDRLAKLNSVEGVKFSQEPTSYQDIAKENRQLKKDLAKAYKDIEKWKNELKITYRLKPRTDDISKLARDLKTRFKSTIPIEKLKEMLNDYGDYLLNGEILTAIEGPDLESDHYVASVKAKAMDIAAELINTSKEMIVEYPEYKEVQKYLMQGVTISDQDKADIPDFNNFRKANIGNVRIVANGLPVDSAYEELSQKYPHLFPDDITSPSDQLIQMAEVADAIRPTKGNPFEFYGLDLAEVVEQTANELINDTAYGQLRATKPTFADKQAAKLKAATADLKAEVKELKEENRKANRMIENLKEKRKKDLTSPKNWKERQRRARNKREAQALRKRIERHVNALSIKLLKPTDARHITERVRDVDAQVERLRSVTAKVLSVINLESNFEYSESELTPKGNPKRAKAGEAGIPTKRTQAFRELKDQYEKIADDGELLTDEALKDPDGLLQDIINFDDTPIQNLGVEDLTKIYNCLRSLERTLDLADKLLTIDRNISDVAMNLVNDNIGKAERGNYSWKFMDNMALGMLTPEAYFHRMGETGDQLFRMFRDAQDKNIDYIDKIRDFFQKNIDLNVNQTEKEIHTVKLGNEEVEMSSAALMELYILSKRQQGLDHIMTGGIRLQEKTSKKGKTRTSVHPITDITQEQLDKAFSQLTQEQRDTADKLQRFVSGYLSRIGNQASMDVYGYEKFTEENYWPINVNKEQLPGADVKTDDHMPSTVANKGMTKAVKPNPKTSVNIGSIFDTFLNHSVEMSEYAAYLATMSDLNRIRNFSYWDQTGHISTMKQLVNHVHGKNGAQYWQKLMSDVANGVKSDNKYFGGWMGKFKATAVGANLRVILQQPTAILRAASLINSKYLAQGVANPFKGSEKAIKYSPIAKWKSWGYFDINTGRSLRDLIMGSETKLQKASELMMAGAGKADDFAWGILWNAVEAETKDTTDLKPGSKEYYEHCAERFAEIVDKTQVVDGVLQRSDILRNGDWAVKMATSFMGEPIKQYNQLMSAVYDMRKNPSKASKRMLIRTGLAMVAAGMTNAMAKSLVDMFRHKKRDKDYWQQFWEEMSGISGDEKDAGETVKNFINGNIGDFINVPGYIPLVKDLESIILGYDVERTDMSVFKDVLDSATKFMRSLTGSKESVLSAGLNFLTQMGKMFGIPASNLWRDTKSTLLDQPLGNNPNIVVAYNYNKLWGNIGEDKNRYIDFLYEAYKKGDNEAYNYIYQDLMANGITMENMQTNFDNHLKMEQYGKKEGVSVDDLKNRYVFKLGKTQDGKNVEKIEGFGSYVDYELNKAAEKKAKEEEKAAEAQAKADISNAIYEGRTYKEIESSSLWSKATTAQQNEIDNKLIQLAEGTNETLQNQVDWARTHYGLSESDWLLYTLARQIVNEQTNNGKGYNKEDKTKAAQMVGLTYAQVNDIEHATSNMKKKK